MFQRFSHFHFLLWLVGQLLPGQFYFYLSLHLCKFIAKWKSIPWYISYGGKSHSVLSDSLPPHGLYIVHGILQARILEWAAVLFSRGFSQQGWNRGLPHCRWILYQQSHQGNPMVGKTAGQLSTNQNNGIKHASSDYFFNHHTLTEGKKDYLT